MPKITIFQPDLTSCVRLPFYLSRVAAGFPSPADDYVEKKLDLNEHLVKSPAATFFVRVSGESMTKAGIFHGDLLIVDRSLEVKEGSIIVAILNGEFTVKRFIKRDGRMLLAAENDAYQPIEIHPDMDFEVWGVVTNVIHSFQ